VRAQAGSGHGNRLGLGHREGGSCGRRSRGRLAGARHGDEPASASLERLYDPARVLALSDGVFAIIITLLVLEVHVPELTQGHSLNEALAELGRRWSPL
jgi:hypothetical protein